MACASPRSQLLQPLTTTSSDWLHCSESLVDTPSTSTSSSTSFSSSSSAIPNILRGGSNENANGQRRIVAALRKKRNSAGNSSVLQPRRRSLNSILNQPVHAYVKTQPDTNLQTDNRLLENLMLDEEHLKPNPHYFTSVQQQIEPSHRQMAVEWILDVVESENCGVEVSLLTVSLIDRFLSLQNIFKTDLQALASAALLIASKIKLPVPINASKISDYTDSYIQPHEIISWELMTVTQLEWQLCSPTAIDFFDQLCARAPHLSILRESFTQVVQALQKSYKLASLFPSLQCCLALSYVASSMDDRTRSNVDKLIGDILNLQMPLLYAYIPLVQRIVLGPAVPAFSLSPPPAPPSSLCLHHSPSTSPTSILSLCPASVPDLSTLTPPKSRRRSRADSGFCSAVSSPESSRHSDSSDVSPPKMARLTLESS